MSRHVIVGRLGTKKASPIAARPDEARTNVLLTTPDGRFQRGIGEALQGATRLGLYPTEIGLDLLVLAALVQAADTRIARATESQDTWTRELRLVTPVSDPGRWKANAKLLERMLAFLTGDLWELEFVERPPSFDTPVAPRPLTNKPPPFDRVCLFSGGLDSLIGAVDVLERNGTPLLVSHAAEGATSGAQASCFDRLKKQYAGRLQDRLRIWMNFPKGLVAGVGSESTTRGRSFLFIAIGIFAGTGLVEPFKLDVPENGLIALNVPLDVLRLGSLSTRTTHPFYLARWNELLAGLGIAGTVGNPYWDKTKGEMISGCANPTFLKTLIAKSMSCASPAKARWKKHGIEHCGYCVPCLIRRAAIKKAWGTGNDPTSYTLASLVAQPLDTCAAQGQQVRSFQLAIARLKAKPGIEKVLIHKPGSLDDEKDRLGDLAGMYRRGMEEVGKLLAGVTTKPC